MKLLAVLLSVLFLTSIGALSQEQDDPWSKYVPRQLGDVVKANNTADMQQQPGVAIVTGSITIKARTVYVRRSRPIPEDKRSLIKLWMQSNRYSEEVFEMFVEEFLFSEDGVEYWLPVQSVLIPHLKSELRKGERVDLFTAWIGVTFGEPGKRKHVFLVNEFARVEKTKKARLPQKSAIELGSSDRSTLSSTNSFMVQPESFE